MSLSSQHDNLFNISRTRISNEMEKKKTWIFRYYDLRIENLACGRRLIRWRSEIRFVAKPEVRTTSHRILWRILQYSIKVIFHRVSAAKSTAALSHWAYYTLCVCVRCDAMRCDACGSKNEHHSICLAVSSWLVTIEFVYVFVCVRLWFHLMWQRRRWWRWWYQHQCYLFIYMRSLVVVNNKQKTNNNTNACNADSEHNRTNNNIA